MAVHTLRLKLKVNSEISYNLEKRFNCVNRCHNILVRRSIQLLNKLAQLILEVVKCDEPPLHLAIGQGMSDVLEKYANDIYRDT